MRTPKAGCFWARPGQASRRRDRCTLGHRRPPPQIQLTSSTDLVEAAHWTVMRGGLDELRIPGDLFDDLSHGGDEAIERGLRFRLGWLDHQRLGHDQGKVDGRRMKPEVDKTLGDILRRHALCLRLFCGEDELVHRWPAEGVVE